MDRRVEATAARAAAMRGDGATTAALVLAVLEDASQAGGWVRAPTVAEVLDRAYRVFAGSRPMTEPRPRGSGRRSTSS